MTSLWQDLLIKVVFEHILLRSDICLECQTYVPPLPKNMLILYPHLEKLSPSTTPRSPPPQKKLPIQLQSLLLYNFCFNFILFVHTGHADFAFNQCSISTECCFQLKKSRNGQIHSSSYSQHPIKKPSKIFHSSRWGTSPSLNAIWKTLHAVSNVM